MGLSRSRVTPGSELMDELPSRQNASIVSGKGGERRILTSIEVLVIDLGKTVCSHAVLDA